MTRNLKTNIQIEIDPDDAALYYSHTWTYDRGYLVTPWLIKGRWSKKYFHRLIMGEPKNKVVDHINGNTLDNRKENLRICSIKENIRNRKNINKNKKSSKYKGVYWHKKNKNWYSRITVDKKNINLGSFSSELSAAEAYNKAAKKYFKNFASLNRVQK